MIEEHLSETERQRFLSFAYSGFTKEIGATFDTIDVGRCVMSLDLKPEFNNPNAFLHGGVTFTLFDTCTGTAVSNAYKDYILKPVTQSTTVYFLHAPKGKKITAEARIIKCGRTTCLAECDVTDELGTLILNGTAQFFILDKIPREEFLKK